MNPDRFKYRVWHKEEKRYVTGNFSISPSGHLHKICGDEDGVYEIELDTQVFAVEQCTGLRDRNGKLIYDGDVVLVGNWRQQRRRGEVVFHVVFHDGCWWVQNNAKSIALLGNLEDEKIQIIGNIHEEAKDD